MNERIQELAKQAGFGPAWFEQAPLGYPALPKEGILKEFAELLVRECASVVLNDAWTDWDEAPSELKAQNIKIAAKLLEHFGIKE